jgi:hypothetical protein
MAVELCADSAFEVVHCEGPALGRLGRGGRSLCCGASLCTHLGFTGIKEERKALNWYIHNPFLLI